VGLARRLRPLIALTAALVAVPTVAAVQPARQIEETGYGSPNMRAVASDEYAPLLEGRGGNAGTDLQFTDLLVDGELQNVAVTGSYYNGMHLFSLANPAAPELLGVWSCGLAQGDIQVFVRDGRTYATFTRDTGYSLLGETECALWAEENAEDAFMSSGGHGTFIADITDPTAPFTVSFVPFGKGSHNQTVHPSGNYLYNSNSELITSVTGEVGIEVTDITDFANPVQVGFLPLPLRPGLGTESHDVTFNTQGTRAYSAALSQTVVIDTTDPATPTVISSFMDPAINVEHQSDPITLVDPILGRREFLIIEDEFAGAVGTGQCPNGGVHVYDITGELEAAPVKVGYWNVSDIGPTNATLGGCTAHVFQLHEEEQLMTIAFYNGGVRVVDLSGLVGVALGAQGVMGMREVARYQFTDSNTWAVKAPWVDRDGKFWIYGNDQNRGFDTYEVDLSGAAPMSSTPGTWLTPQEVLARALANPVDLTDYKPFCLLGDQ